MNITLSSALAEAETRYSENNPRSAARHQAAALALPGGNTRTVLHYSPFPLAWARGEGACLYDLDGHRYNDFLGEHSAGLYGHSHPIIRKAITNALEAGIVLGGPNLYEADLAAEIRRRFPSMELLRFCNSGTEANLFAIQTARAVTGRHSVLAFSGAYHGGVFYFRNGENPINLSGPWIMAPYNDADAATGLIERHARDLAAVIVEPMLGGGCIPALPGFLHSIRSVCDKFGVLLIFDEVMTSRVAFSGAQGLFGVKPDMTTLGKYLGGGLSFGSFGGRSDIMRRFDPTRLGAWPHAGTFNNNVLSMAAGLAGLKSIFDAEAISSLNAKAERLRTGINWLAEKHQVDMVATGIGSFVGLHFKAKAPLQPYGDDVGKKESQEQLRALMHLDMIAAGQFFGRSGFMALSLPISNAQIDALTTAIEEFLQSRRGLIE